MPTASRLAEIPRLLDRRNLIGLALTLVVLPWLFGWELGSALIIAMFFHEMGHILAFLHYGIGVREIRFMILGAAVTPNRPYANGYQNAFCALAGPMTGILIGGLGLVVWHLTGWGYARALAFVGIGLNLFNLLPVLMLDGGHVWRVIVAAFSPKQGHHVMLGVSVAIAATCGYFDQWFIACVLGAFALLNYTALRMMRRLEHFHDQAVRIVFGLTNETPTELAERLRKRVAKLRSGNDADELQAIDNDRAVYRFRNELLNDVLAECEDRFTAERLSQMLRNPRPDLEDFIELFLLPPGGEPLKPRQALVVFGGWLTLTALLGFALWRNWPMFF